MTIKSRLNRTEKVNERETEYLMHSYTTGLFKVFYDGKRTIEYTAPAAISLSKFLKNRILEEKVFWKIIAQIAKIEKTVELSGLYPNNLLVEINTIFINEVTQEIYFIYQPLIGARNTGNTLAVIKDITYMEVKKCAGMPGGYLLDFQNFLNQENHYQMEQITEYIHKVYPGIREVICDAECGRSGFLTTNHLDYEKHYGQKGGGGADNETVCLQDEGTVLLGEEEDTDYGETVVLTQEHQRSLTLLHQKEQRSLSVTKDWFRMGKSGGNEYCISGNSAVSRRHAVIIKRGNAYYLKDTKSTNGTFLNGKRLEAEEEALLSDGDEFVLADEVFTVEIE